MHPVCISALSVVYLGEYLGDISARTDVEEEEPRERVEYGVARLINNA